jgi:hypothetical protein
MDFSGWRDDVCWEINCDDDPGEWWTDIYTRNCELFELSIDGVGSIPNLLREMPDHECRRAFSSIIIWMYQVVIFHLFEILFSCLLSKFYNILACLNSVYTWDGCSHGKKSSRLPLFAWVNDTGIRRSIHLVLIYSWWVVMFSSQAFPPSHHACHKKNRQNGAGCLWRFAAK